MTVREMESNLLAIRLSAVLNQGPEQKGRELLQKEKLVQRCAAAGLSTDGTTVELRSRLGKVATGVRQQQRKRPEIEEEEERGGGRLSRSRRRICLGFQLPFKTL